MITVIKSPFVQYKLTILRNKKTSNTVFRQTMNEISYLIASDVLQYVPFKTFGDKVFSISLVFFVITLFYIFKIQDNVLKSFSFRKKSILYIFFTLIPIIRYLISNNEILFFIEQVKLVSYFFLISFCLIFIFSNIVDSVLDINFVLPVITVFLFIAFLI